MTAAALIALTAGPLAAQGPSTDAPAMVGGKHHMSMKKHHGHHMARLTVSGQGQASAQPDIATVTLGVGTRAASAGEAMTQNSETQAKIIETLKAAGGNKSETARRLGITRKTLHKKLKAYGVMK